MKLDIPKLGAGMLAAGPVLIQIVGTKVGWWIGFGFTICGPVLMAVKTKGKSNEKAST